MEKKNKRRVGGEWEEFACGFLKGRGVYIKDRNVKAFRAGEIDIVGIDGDGVWIFAEVKYRKNGKAGCAQEAVTAAKQYNICRTADYYRTVHRIPFDSRVRFDVVAINGPVSGGGQPRVDWIKNAFDYVGMG